MHEVVRAYPDRTLNVVVDNLNIHKNQAARRWLGRHPRLYFHYTPRHPFTWTTGPESLRHIIETTKDDQAFHPKKPRVTEPNQRKPLLQGTNGTMHGCVLAIRVILRDAQA